VELLAGAGARHRHRARTAGLDRSIANLNEMRSLERVIAQMDTPSRQGFERLQRPLSFRKLVE